MDDLLENFVLNENVSKRTQTHFSIKNERYEIYFFFLKKIKKFYEIAARRKRI